MAPKTQKTARKSAPKSTLLNSIKKHPFRTAGIAGGAALGVALLAKAANTAAKVVTIKATSDAVTDVARVMRQPVGRNKK